VIEPLLVEEPPKLKGGRPRVPDRSALTGILFVFKRGILWEMLPQRRWAVLRNDLTALGG
jgi:transposase